MTASVFLIFMALTQGGVPIFSRVDEMPNMRTCESAGNQLAAMARYSKWTCIETSR